MTTRPLRPDDGPRRFATIWSRAIFPMTATSVTRPEFERYLLPLAHTLGIALHTRPFDPSPGREVGAALVAAECVDPDALPQILGVVDAYLVLYCRGESPLPVDEGRFRCTRLQHAVAAGYARALRDRARLGSGVVPCAHGCLPVVDDYRRADSGSSSPAG